VDARFADRVKFYPSFFSSSKSNFLINIQMKNQSKIIIVIAVLFISTTNIKAQNNAIIDINACHH